VFVSAEVTLPLPFSVNVWLLVSADCHEFDPFDWYSTAGSAVKRDLRVRLMASP
jgi:hypothetical protein